MSVEIKSNSRLKFANLLIVDDVEFWDTVVLPDFTPSRNDIVHVVSQSDRIDLIASRYYQDAALWWVVAWANNLEILPSDMKEGTALVIPPKDYVTNLLKKSSRRA